MEMCSKLQRVRVTTQNLHPSADLTTMNTPMYLITQAILHGKA